LAKADANPENVGAAFCRHAWCDGEGKRMRISELHRESAGILEDFMELIASQQRIQTPSVVVQRQLYRELGGFRGDLSYTLDWEMWQRIATRFPIWFDPRVLAVYRLHRGAETSRIRRSQGFGKEYLHFFEIVSVYHDVGSRSALKSGRKRYAVLAVQEARDLLVVGKWLAGFRELIFAAKLGISLEYWRACFSFAWLWGCLLWVGAKSFFRIGSKYPARCVHE
jgi:hypothetical protein